MEFTENDIKKIVKDELRKFSEESLNKEVGKALSRKNNPARDELIRTIKDSMEQIFKVLWQKKEFWKQDVK
jgi:DNA-binding transcriptional regulator WhiA